MTESKNIELLRGLATPYMFESLFRPKKPVIPEVKYGKNNLQIARRIDNNTIYPIDLSESCRIVVLGATRCLPMGTQVEIGGGKTEKIERCRHVISFNFETGLFQTSRVSTIYFVGQQKKYAIKTAEDILYCSHNHIWIIDRDGEILDVETKDIDIETDKLLNVVGKTRVRIVDIYDTGETCEMVDIEVPITNNFILDNGFLTHNSGKTYFLRSIGDRIYQTGRDLIYLSDVKNEFFCVSTNQKIMTNNGLKEIKYIEEGKDKVLSRDLINQNNVFNDFKKSNIKKERLFEIEFEDGSSIQTTEEHRLFDENLKEIEVKNVRKGTKIFSGKTHFSGYFLFIKNIRCLGYRDVMDISVENNSNYYLGNGVLSHNSSKNPVQEKFRCDLLPGETPTGMPVVTLRPTFFKSISPELPQNNFWYSIDMNKLSKADFMTLLNVENMTPTQKISMDIVFENLIKKFNEGNTFSLDLIENIIDEIDELSNLQKNSLKFKFRPLRDSKFIENEYERSIVSLLQHPKRFVPAINMENFDSFIGSAFQFSDVVLNVALREAIMARRAGKIKPLWVVIDESARFIGNNKSGCFKTTVLESCDLDTRYNVNYIYAVQVIESLPESILKQCKYIFIPSTADLNTIKNVLVQTAMVKNQQVAPNQAMKLKQKMRSVKFSWIILNRMDGSMELVKPLAPLSEHMETSQ